MKIAIRFCSLSLLFIHTLSPLVTAKDLLTHEVKPEQELLITDLKVTDSHLAEYPGVLSFGYVMDQIAKSNEIEDKTRLILSLLKHWEEDQVVNQFTVPARQSIRELVIDPWKKADGQAGVTDEEWQVDYANAPFRLTAVVNRLDLASIPELEMTADDFEDMGIDPDDVPGLGGASYASSSTGELRFTYCVCDQETGEPLAGDFTLITEMEYRAYDISDQPEPAPSTYTTGRSNTNCPNMPANTTQTSSSQRPFGEKDLQRWAMRWHQLGAYETIDNDYLAALENLVHDNIQYLAEDRKTNLGQIRTNEAALAQPREMREFVLGSLGFEQVPVDQTPDLSFTEKHTKENRALADYINDNSKVIKLSRHLVDETLKIRRDKVPFLAGSALIPDDDFHWDARQVHDRLARRAFSMNTCNGCHAAETGISGGMHISTRKKGEPAVLSSFLTVGDTQRVRDPARRAHRDKMNEMEKRIAIYTSILSDDANSSRALRGLKAERNAWAH